MSGASSGLFVTFEGVDGAGKSTQLRAAAEALRAQGLRICETREPGGAPGAEEIRRLLVSGETDRWTPMAELLLFNAARRDHLDRTIAPALARGEMVLCDRFVDSTRAYQSVGRGAAPDDVERLHQLAIGREADLTLIFDIAPETALARADGPGEDRFERFGLEFQNTLRAAFLEIARNAPKRCVVIDAARAQQDVLADVLNAIQSAVRK